MLSALTVLSAQTVLSVLSAQSARASAQFGEPTATARASRRQAGRGSRLAA